jgi:DNA-binding helix-hairpin-helix protein with protein kinase domain
MAKKIIPVPERLHSQAHASEPEGAEEIEQTKEEVEEIEEEKPIVKPKRVLTEKQLESLKRAREAAALKKRELKELAQKAKALPKKEIEVKAAEYDKLEEKKKQLTQPPPIKKNY